MYACGRFHNAFFHGSSRLQLGIALGLLAGYLLASLFHSGKLTSGGVPALFQAMPLDMSLTGTQLWDDSRKSHGYAPRNVDAFKSLGPYDVTCGAGFFALWPSDCTDKFAELDDRMRTLSAQMQAMNASLVLYTTGPGSCEFPYPGVSVQVFNATELLLQTGFAAALPIMATWKKTRYTRISDILRIGLALRSGRSYLDTDVTFLLLRSDPFLRAYAGAALWSNAKNALEITNAAFCLPRPVLLDMLAFQRSRVLSGPETYFYTEMGPSMFHNVLLNRFPVTLYSQNHPAQPSLDAIARDVHQYGHTQLHLTGHVRKGNARLSFAALVNALRAKCGLPLFVYPPSSRFALAHAVSEKNRRR